MNRCKRLAWVGIACLCAALACNQPGGAAPAPSALPPGTRVVTVVELANQVVTSPSEGGPESPAASGQVLPPGSQISTKGQSTARLNLPEAGNLIRLAPETTLAVRQLETTSSGPVSRFHLASGKVWLILNPDGGEGTVETPGGTASARGQMSVEYDPASGTFRVTCLTGVCSANNPFGGLALSPGQQTEAAGSAGLAPPHPIDPDELSDWQRNAPEADVARFLAGETPTSTETPSEAPPPPPGNAEASETPTFTPTTDTETPSPTPLGAPCVTATSDGNVRGGPGSSYLVYGVLHTGETAEVVGKDQTGTWFVILFPSAPGGKGWIWDKVVEKCGDHSNVPVVLPPATPTFTPSFTPSITPTVASATPNKPGASISADSTNINEGDCTTLHWTATNAREVYLNGQGIAGETSRQVCPTETTSYTLHVVGYDNSTADASVTVNVTPSGKP